MSLLIISLTKPVDSIIVSVLHRIPLMKQPSLYFIKHCVFNSTVSYKPLLIAFISGLLGPLAFAPFHMPGLIFISIASLYFLINSASPKKALLLGFIWGLGFFSVGVSWVIVSIHDYGQIHYLVASLITLGFVSYLALYPGLVCSVSQLLNRNYTPLASVLMFSSLWCIGEFTRANLMTGFPWLLLGISQMDTPIRYLAPYLGIYGLSFFTVLASCCFTCAITGNPMQRITYACVGVLILIAPISLDQIRWTVVQEKAVSVGAVQANLSMRDKWDEALFYKLLSFYEDATEKLLGTDLIILPESAIPLPTSYVDNYLYQLHKKAYKSNSALLLGILQPTDEEESHYYNSVISLGKAEGRHGKSHLVPFGEYIPWPFITINRLLHLPEPNVAPDRKAQSLITVHSHQVASLICYEVAYSALLKQQMPEAEWIISISDNGWFGKSFASYQQLQMSQMLSLLTGRFQVVVNNDGLSSIINERGQIIKSLPAFKAGILKGELYPVTGTTPWIYLGDYPILIFCSIIVLFIPLLYFYRRRLRLPIAGE